MGWYKKVGSLGVGCGLNLTHSSGPSQRTANMDGDHPVSRSFGSSPRVVPRPEYPSFLIPIYYQFKALFVTVGYGMLLLYLLHDSVWIRSVIFCQDALNLKDEALIFTVLVSIYHTAIYLLCNVPFMIFDSYNMYQEYKLHRNDNALPTPKLINETLVTAFVSQALTSPILSYFTYSLFVAGGMTSNLSALPNWKDQVLHLAIAHLFQDLLFYITHRAFHSNALYWIHKQHHSYAGTMSISAEYAHPIEVLVANIFPTLGGLPLLGKCILSSLTYCWEG